MFARPPLNYSVQFPSCLYVRADGLQKNLSLGSWHASKISKLLQYLVGERLRCVLSRVFYSTRHVKSVSKMCSEPSTHFNVAGSDAAIREDPTIFGVFGLRNNRPKRDRRRRFLMRRAQLRGRAGCYRSTVQAPFTAFLCGHEKGVPRGPSSWDSAPVSSSN